MCPELLDLQKLWKICYEQERDQENIRLSKLRDKLIHSVTQKYSGADLTGHPVQRLPNHASFVLKSYQATIW
jgi:cysteine sulfinate desulfinase/cysteine desulfurase-like protein